MALRSSREERDRRRTMDDDADEVETEYDEEEEEAREEGELEDGEVGEGEHFPLSAEGEGLASGDASVRESLRGMESHLMLIKEQERLKQEEAAKNNAKKEIASNLWPELEDKFRPADVKKMIELVVKENLEGQAYDAEEMPRLVKVVTDEVHSQVRTLQYKRYKIITHVAMGERRGEGITAVTRCVWDPMSDCLATYNYLSDTVFCCVTVYGIYFY